MAFSWQQIKYGWVILTGIAITGTTIYVVNNQRKHVQQIDIIQIAPGTHERCLATQYSTNPVSYRVNPPSFTRSWKNTNGVIETVTNAIGFFSDYTMMKDLDTKIKALVPYYGMSNSPGENWTVTGLWAYLNIGDGTNQFTQTPAIGTNPATYGDYAHQVYPESLQERYKVLNAMRYFIDENKTIVSNYDATIVVWGYPIERRTYSNTVDGTIDYGYTTGVGIEVELAKSYVSFCGYSPFYTNFYGWSEIGQTGVTELTWAQIYGWAQIYWDSIATPLPGSGNFNLYYQCHKYVPDYTGYLGWRYQWRTRIHKPAVIFKWVNYQYTNIPSSFSVYYAGATTTADSVTTEIATNSSWNYPRSWNLEYGYSFEENLISSPLYQKVGDEFIDIEGENNVLNLGWDETFPGSVPPPTICAEPSGGISYMNNSGSVGISLGMTIPLANFKGVRDFQFSYCTNKYW